MKIGDLARLSGIPVETIRFYEREGMLPAPARTASNYRVYDRAHAERLAFVRHCRTLDMALDEIRVLLRFKDQPEQNCGEVNRVLDEHIAHVTQRITELDSLRAQLLTLRSQCHDAQDAGHCGILQGLSEDSGARPPKRAHVRATHSPR